MCERLALPDQATAEREFQPAHAWWKFAIRFNVAARQYVPAVRVHQRQSEAVMLRWGLIPPRTEGQAAAVDTPLCVEAEAIEGSWPHAWRASQRCILPVSGFYAWRLTSARYRQPYFVRLMHRSVFGIAAIWDRCESDDGDVVESCSIVCVPANEMMLEVDNSSRRMPAILRRKHYAAWLQGRPAEAKAALVPYSAELMEAHKVSPRINSTAPDDPELIRPAA